ncbi:ATP-binding cassette domain-containing protein [uncultured Roseobacter sp.]|uniref:ABC transporter ATP-binding protein n=1 Tax=uncultured Roseobacter sp. TaxID=114847 RepID=UPI00261E8586|nr:ATP-binding cassette domain-containing protein [uncultured Roseobacter sp.]
MSLLELRNLSGGYDPIQIFSHIDLTIEAGESIGFFGPNGHGKSTLMKTISGVLAPWTGDVIFDGQRMNRVGDRGSRRWRNFNYDVVTRRRMDPKTVARAGLIHVPEGNLLFPEMTVAETLAIAPIAGRGRGDEAHQLELVHALFPRLRERLKSKIRFLSGGERQMVAISVGLMGNPKLMILDEPTLGLSPKLRQELCQAVGQIKASGVPLILIDQDVTFLTELIDRLYLFDHGRISRKLEKSEIPSHDDLMAMLFGDHAA